jgi:hypothetical protein
MSGHNSVTMGPFYSVRRPVTRKRWRINRTMVVPAQWQGSVEHFYHFFFGYFMPLVLWQERTGAMEFTVRDCGPMNPWFSLLRPGTDVDLMPPGVMLQRVLTRRQNMQILRGWDDPTRFHRASLERFSRTILDRVGVVSGSPSSLNRRITVLNRAPSPSYYVSDKSETFSSGADWRSLPNVQVIAAALGGLGDVTVLDTAALTPGEQVRALSNTDLLVAQHGAGMSNIVWLPAGSAVLEIKPPLMPTIDTIFANLAGARRIDHAAVDQADEFAPVDPACVLATAELLVSTPGDHVPTMTGRLPMRALRQMPRRI